MAVYCWGNTEHGELGLGGIEEEKILEPRLLPWDVSDKISTISCGRWHTLFLTSDGQVFSCGNNDNGQLGHDKPTKRPRMSPFKLITELGTHMVKQISCGGNHSVALDEWGHMFAWGGNAYGQLGMDKVIEHLTVPKLIKQIHHKTFIQIASGNNHNIALTNAGEIYTWGCNAFGQLGMATQGSNSSEPLLVKSLHGIPVAHVACGGNHSFVISKSGAVFGFGRNNCGQLGLNDHENRRSPAHLKTMRNLGVRYIACGDEFSVFLTNDGGVFTCGAGNYGQLGHGGYGNEVLPRMVLELMGSTITQVACGMRHTLALVPSRGRVYGFGLGCSGQLGTRFTKNSPVPQVVIGPWVSPSGTALLENGIINTKEESVTVKQIFSGGDHCLVTTANYHDHTPAIDARLHDSRTQILTLTTECAKKCAHVGKLDVIDLDLLNEIEIIFMSQSCLNGSFLRSVEQHICCNSKRPGVDLEEAKEAFSHIRKIENENLKKVIWYQITKELLKTLSPNPADMETLRIYLILPLYHEFINSKNYADLHSPFGRAVLSLLEKPSHVVKMWWAATPMDWFEQMVCNFKNVVAHIISFKIVENTERERIVTPNPDLLAALNLLQMLHDINHSMRENKLHYEVFHWPELTDYVDVQYDYITFVHRKNQHFSICNYPFIMDAATKTILLQTDQALQMHTAMLNDISRFHYFLEQPLQYIVLNVTRENIVQDTLREISRYNQSDLKKPLKIKFHGEEAEDAGGVRKEFFMLLLRDIIDPKYGMFKEYEDSRAVWFADFTFETEDMYFLIGIICGLAIYNFTIINLPFPLALYKKLLDEPVDMSDLRDLSPELANSMQSILDYEGDDFENVFNLNFEITRNIFGEAQTVPLKPNGENIPVTQENKKEFVELYIDYVFNKASESQFMAFRKGFRKVCWGEVLKIFKPHELMAVVVGNQEYDWDEFERNCEYKNGYSETDQTIKWFWEVFHELPTSEKKKFLLYLTGSDRIPIQGMKEIQMTIQPTADDRFLPVAHTCFNLLDLPRYQTKERLKFKLLQAIQQTEGFSLV